MAALLAAGAGSAARLAEHRRAGGHGGPGLPRRIERGRSRPARRGDGGRRPSAGHRRPEHDRVRARPAGGKRVMTGGAIRMGTSQPRRLLLVASLALNLFFVGLAVAVAIQEARERTAVPAPVALDRSPAARIDRLAAALPAADAQALRTRFQGALGVIDAAQTASRVAQDKVRAALAAEPFDSAAADTALTQLREARRALWRALHGVIIAAAGEMSAEGRARLASWVPPDEGERGASPQPQSR
ncbi:MAG: hypothetical protein B7Z45_00780 [Azorhizobium sp. 12-66-6]|nr:MAG: hypothetical protein B7Z45_00780 [Azorhizobium sp. 12-66-6]